MSAGRRTREANLAALGRSTRGAGMVEYIVIAAVVALAAIAGYRTFGNALERKVDDEGQHVTSLSAYGGSGGSIRPSPLPTPSGSGAPTPSSPPASTTPPTSSTTPPPASTTPPPATSGTTPPPPAAPPPPPPAAPPPPPPAPAPTNPVLSGHGSYDPNNGMTTVPPGTTVVMPTWHNVPISDAYGGAIESGQPISSTLFPEMDGQHIYPPGSQIPNYTLHPPTGLNIQTHPTLGAPQQVTSDTNLDGLLQPNQGQISWAACMVDFCQSYTGSPHTFVPSFPPQNAQPNNFPSLPPTTHPNWPSGVTPVSSTTPLHGTLYPPPTPMPPPAPPAPPPVPTTAPTP